MSESAPAAPSGPSRPQLERIVSIDALRGFVMFTMIFVNDLAGVSEKVVPAWMRHFHGKSGMTFVDMVFPGFLFIVGMSIPFSFNARLEKGEPVGKLLWHIFIRTASLLLVGIMMVNETPDSKAMGWSGTLWVTLMFLCAILAFCHICPQSYRTPLEAGALIWRRTSLILRVAGFAGLAFLAFSFRSANGQRIITLSPFSIHTEWYGILGLIGWAYLAGSIVYLIFRNNRTALLGSAMLLLGLFAADRTGGFHNFWLARYVGIGETLGSQGAITVAGLLLGSMLIAPEMSSVRSRTVFTLLFVAGFSAGALLLQGLYGINKNSATPSWCLWACAFTAALWLIFYFLCDIKPVGFIAKPLAIAGQNVLLAYLLSEMFPSALDLAHLGDWYGRLADANLARAIVRSAGCGLFILCVTACLNRVGFRVRL